MPQKNPVKRAEAVRLYRSGFGIKTIAKQLKMGNETVHHKDGNRQNNDLNNLQLRQGNHGRGAVFQCGDCGSHNIVPRNL